MVSCVIWAVECLESFGWMGSCAGSGFVKLHMQLPLPTPVGQLRTTLTCTTFFRAFDMDSMAEGFVPLQGCSKEPEQHPLQFQI